MGMPLGSSSSDLTRPDGSALPIFAVETLGGGAVGGEARVAYALTRALTVEGVGTWSRLTVRTAVTNDIENAADVTIDNHLRRVTVEGAAVWSLVRGVRTTLFVRGSVGWMREMTDGLILAENGRVGTLGGGVKYWWRRADGSRPLAFRVEGRAFARSRGVALGEPALQVTPAVVAGVDFMF
jgi:hypothetical protein